MIDLKTLKNFNKGDARAFEKVYNDYYTVAFLVALKYTHDEEEAKDMRSECFAKLWQLSGTMCFQTPAQLATWVRHTIRNNCIDHLRHVNIYNKKKDHILLRYIQEIQQQPEVFEAIDKEAAIIERLYHGIEALPNHHKQVFKLRWLGDLKFIEISTALKVELSTVKKRYARALFLLKQFLHS